MNRRNSDGELVEMVDKRQSDYSVVHGKQTRKSSCLTIAVLFVVSVILVTVGISLIVLSSAYTSCKGKARVKPHMEYCHFSDEAKRAGLDDFLFEVQRSFFKLHPHKSYHDPLMDLEQLEAIQKTYKAFNPSPSVLKAITDTSIALLEKLNGIQINKDKLKPRESKVLAQAKHYLQHTFGQPYDVNYYAGDWMLGPNQFCWQPVCEIGEDIYYHLDYFKPEKLDDVKKLRIKLKEHADGISQYISNMKEGVRHGMIRSIEECKAGIDAVKQKYLNISLRNETGVLDSWFMKFVMAPEFLSAIPKKEQEKWYELTGKRNISEAVQEDFVEFIGKPIVTLIRYLEEDHLRHCVPSTESSGLHYLPRDYVYVDGVTTKNKTIKTLPTGEALNGRKTYEKSFSYFTTNNMTPDQIHDLGKKQINVLYPQMLEIARNVTQLSNESEAVKKFREMLSDQSNYFNDEPFPKNESNDEAHKKCSGVEGAKKHCPKRWEAAEKWWSAARMAMSFLDPKTLNMFYFTGKKHTTPNCPIELYPDFNPSSAAQSYIESNKQCTSGAFYNLPFFLDNAGPRFAEWSVNAHEARPGHHTQVQGNVEHFQDNCKGTISWLNKVTYYTAYVEGWGLYAESPLIAETDVYDDNLMQKFGMLKWQIWRALRLIVDTGLHYKGLKRADALALFDKYAWDNSDIAKKEVTRYQSSFGQANAYMIGQILLKQLRDYAKENLKEKFELREFHFQVLSQGPSPLEYLSSHIHKYVDCKLNKSTNGCDIIHSSPEMSSDHQERRMVAGKPAKPVVPNSHHRHYL